jgi:hypothetical protein
VCGTFECLNQFFHVVILQSRTQPQGAWLHKKALPRHFPTIHQSDTQKPVHRSLQRSTGTPNLPPQKLGDIFIKSESCSHIMMFA